MAADGIVDGLEGPLPHRVGRLHATFAHRSGCHRVTRENVHKFLVVDAARPVGVARGDKLVQLMVIDGHIPQVEGAPELRLVERAAAVDVDVLEGLHHVREARVERVRCLTRKLQVARRWRRPHGGLAARRFGRGMRHPRRHAIDHGRGRSGGSTRPRRRIGPSLLARARTGAA